MEPKIISESPVSMSELKGEIDKIKKREEESSMRVNKTEEYLNSFNLLSPSKEKELVEAINKLNIPRLKEEHITKIVDLLPRTADELKLIMQGYVISLSNENLQKIAETVKSLAPTS